MVSSTRITWYTKITECDSVGTESRMNMKDPSMHGEIRVINCGQRSHIMLEMGQL